MATTRHFYQKTVNITPVAGKGQRFVDAGYKLHKSLLCYNKIPIFIKAAKSLPPSNQNIFVLISRDKKTLNLQIKKIKQYFKRKHKIIILNKETKGQADTILKVSKYIKKEMIINVASSDTFCNFNKNDYYNMIEKKNEVIVWTTKILQYHKKIINNFGLVKSNPKFKIQSKKIVKNLKGYSIINGFFTFTNSKKLFSSIKKIKQNKKYYINNEIYLDTVCDYYSKNYNSKVCLLNTTYNIVYGTPKEYQKFKK